MCEQAIIFPGKTAAQSGNERNEIMDLTERMTASRLVYDGKVVHLYVDTVELPDGSSSVREYVKHIGAVCVVPLTDEGEVLLERQYRYAVGRTLTEIPAGKLDSREEDRLSAIQRELWEETGFTAEEWVSLGDFHPAPAYSDEYISMYMARKLRAGERHLDADEFLDVFTVPLSELVEDVMAGRISDAKTQTAVLKAARLLGV